MQELRAMDPRQLGPYWLAGRLGAGGQGVVYEGYDGAGARVAVKALHLDADSGVADQLRREVRMLERVAPFCTAQVVAADLDHVPPYVASQYIPGPTLQQMVTGQGPYPADALIRLAVGMATALVAIHAARVVHRDLKPENVLIGPDGPRVIDFGIARAPDLTRSTTGVIKGTPRWMAPETFLGQPATSAVDVWAWGAILVFAATGVPPFDGSDVVQIMQSVQTAEPDLGALPQPLRALVARALLRDPTARPGAAELLAGLTGSGVHAGAGTGADAGSGVASLAAFGPPGSAVMDVEERMAAGQRAAAALVAPAVALPLGETAERLYTSLPAPLRALVPRVLLRLVTSAPDAAGTLRAADPSELAFEDASAEEVGALVNALLGAGVLTQDPGSGRLVLASAALVRAWGRLREWVEDERDALAACHELAETALRWHGHGRLDADVLHGTALEQALAGALTRRGTLALSDTEKAYLAASLAADRRRSRRRRQVLAVVAALVLTVGAVGSYAFQQSRDASAQRKQAALQQQVAALAKENAHRIAAVDDAANLAADAQAVREHDPATAAAFAVAAYHSSPISTATSQLFASVGSQLSGVVADAGPAVERMAAQPDGPLVAADDVDQHLRIWNFANPAAPVAGAVLPAHAGALAFVPHSSRLVAGCEIPQHGLCLWDLADPKSPRSIASLPLPATIKYMPTAMAVSPDGSLVATAGLEGTAYLWSLAQPGHPALLTTLANPSTRKDGGSLAGVAFSAHGGLLATTILGGRTTLWSLAKPAAPTKVATLPTGYQGIAFGPAGPGSPAGPVGPAGPDSQLLAAVGDMNVGLWNIATPSKPQKADASLGSCPSGFSVDLDALAFRPDGQELDYGGEGTNGSSGQLCRVRLTPGGANLGPTVPPVSSVDFLTMAYTADGRLLTGGDEGKIRSWPTESNRIIGVDSDSPPYLTVTPDGRLLAVPRPRSQSDNLWPVAIYDLKARSPYGPQRIGTFDLPASDGIVSFVSFVNAHTLLTVQLDGTVLLWDLTDPRHPVQGARLGTAYPKLTGGFTEWQYLVSVDTAGDLAAILSKDRRVHLWRIAGASHATEVGSFPYVESGLPTTSDTHTSTVALLLPDGRTVMVPTSTGIDWWDVHDPAYPVKGGTTPIDFSNGLGESNANAGPDGDLVAFTPNSGLDGTTTLHLIKVRDGSPVSTFSPKDVVGKEMTLSDDNHVLVTSAPAGDGLTFWDVRDPGRPRVVDKVSTLASVSSINISHDSAMTEVTDDTGNGPQIELWNTSNPARPHRIAVMDMSDKSEFEAPDVSFTLDGRQLMLRYWDAVAFVDIDPEAVAADLCAAIGNTVTPAQWNAYAAETSFRKPCP